MKPVLFVFLLAISVHLSATHIKTARIRYEYIGDSTGINYQYKVILNIYKGVNSIPLGAYQTIDVESSCVNKTTVNLDIDTFYTYLSGYSDCDTAVIDVENWQFSGIVNLSNCSDWRFTWKNCCRPPSINNLVDNSIFHISTSLNTLIGPNNSAVAAMPHPKVFCTNRDFSWNRSYRDADGDSIYVTYSALKYDDSTFIAFKPSFSDSNPLEADSIKGYHVDDRTGNVKFTPTSIGNYYVGYKVLEYRSDTLFPLYIVVGEHYEETFVTIKSNCINNQLLNISHVDTISAECGSNKLRFQTEDPYLINSLHHTDFSFLKPSGVPNPTTSASPDTSYAGWSDSVILDLHYPIQENGIYKLVSRYGFDGNTLNYKCGSELKVYDTLYCVVSGCSAVGLNQLEKNDFVRVYPVPAENVLNIENDAKEDISYRLINAKGVVCLKGERIKEHISRLDISMLPQGIYMMIVHENNRQQIVPINITR